MRDLFGSRTLVNAARLLLAGGSLGLLLHAAPSLVAARSGPPAPSPAVAVTDRTAADLRLASLPSAPRPAVDAPVAQEPAASSSPRLTTVAVTRELDIPHWLRPGEYAWNDEGAPADGPTVVVVNIRARVLSVYRAGVEIGRSSLIYGADNKPTPTGEFPVLEKDADHVSNLYDAPMPHMLRLTWDGVALHGSPELRDDLATRGCVGLPREFAALLFDVVDVGDRVIVWDGETTA